MFFSDHLIIVLASSIAVISLFTLGAVVAQFIDADHSGPWSVKANCAIKNNIESCPQDVLKRGFAHTFQFLLLVLGFTVFMVGASFGLIVHLMSDEII